MAVFKCEKCGATKEGRCKPKKCPECTEAGTMQKQEEKKSSHFLNLSCWEKIIIM